MGAFGVTIEGDCGLMVEDDGPPLNCTGGEDAPPPNILLLGSKPATVWGGLALAGLGVLGLSTVPLEGSGGITPTPGALVDEPVTMGLDGRCCSVSCSNVDICG